MLLGGVPGTSPGHVLVIGGGVVGENAAYMAVGMGADVTVLDRNVDTMRSLVRRFGQSIKTLYSTQLTLEEEILGADLVVGAVLVPGAEADRRQQAFAGLEQRIPQRRPPVGRDVQFEAVLAGVAGAGGGDRTAAKQAARPGGAR